MKYQRNIFIEFIFSHPKWTIIFCLYAALWSMIAGLWFYPIPKQVSYTKTEKNIIDTKPLPKKKIIIEQRTKQEKEELLKMINGNYITDEKKKQETQKVLDDVILLSQLIQSEAGNQDAEGKCLVADVVMNRVRSDRFPNTVEEVIYQKGQFGVVTDGSLEKAKGNVSKESLRVACLAMSNPNEALSNDKILFFNTESNIEGGKNWFQHGDHWFGE